MPGRSASLLPLILLAGVACAGALAYWYGGFSFESFVRHREEIDRFVADHRLVAVLGFIAIYSAAVSLSIPGGIFLTVTGGFLFGVALGAAASVLGASIGATFIFLLARSAIGEPLLKRAGPRAAKLARGFRQDAFSYLLFLRLIPAFPFFLVNLVPALAGVRLAPFVAATVLGITPASLVYALAGRGLGSIIDMQLAAQSRCLARGESVCPLAFDARDILTPELIAALVGLALLALLPVLVTRLRRPRSVAE
jgi:uncharacterized membrane protein YdjX (TVP38/TMEM64 family)